MVYGNVCGVYEWVMSQMCMEWVFLVMVEFLLQSHIYVDQITF